METLHIMGLALAGAGVLPWTRLDARWIRIFDFPHPQLAGAGIAVLLGYRVVDASFWGYAVQLLVVLATLC